VELTPSLGEIPRLARLICSEVTPEELTVTVGSAASACAPGLSVTTVEDVGASAGVAAAVLPDVAASPDVSDVLDAPPPVEGYVCAVAELMAETDTLSSG
jgi:hypothetical protein